MWCSQKQIECGMLLSAKLEIPRGRPIVNHKVTVHKTIYKHKNVQMNVL